MAEIAYNLKDLIAAAAAAEGVNVAERTAQRYVAECLPPPARTGNTSAPYQELHLLRLRLVIRLSTQYVPLREIARFLDRIPLAGLRVLVGRPPSPRSPAEGDVHAYLERLYASLPPGALAPVLPGLATVRPGQAVPTPRPRRPAPQAAPVPALDVSEWLRVVVDPDVELLLRTRPGADTKSRAERLASALRAALAAEGGN